MSSTTGGRKLSHLDEKGAARMVDVSGKDVTERVARAAGFVKMKPETLALIETGEAKKGDVLAPRASPASWLRKETSDLIPHVPSARDHQGDGGVRGFRKRPWASPWSRK